MCGIAGIVRFAGLRPGEHRLGQLMAATLRHRGPDESGLFADHHASLGHARLSIIDLRSGQQPMSNEDGTIHVVFNGEIYNHRDLADQLRSRGHHLKTRCDTEVLVHLYEDFGESFLEHLNGMFGLALWDARRHKLVLARDRLGIKPLYWHDDGCRILFGSELKAIPAAGNVEQKIDLLALQDYLTFGHVPAPKTIFQSIRKLEPGHMAICTASGTTVRQWWDIPFVHACPEPTSPFTGRCDGAEKWVDEFSDLLKDAIRLRMISDVPLGAFLSGGVDSSAIVAGMCHHSSGPVLTHTIGFDETDCDERDGARRTARVLQTDHHEVMVRPDAASAAEQLTRHFDEPFADACAISMFYLSQAARQRVTVALSGDGGDEMLAGYRRYRFDLAEAALRSRCPRWIRQTVLGTAGWLYPKGDWLPRPLRAKTTLQNLAHDHATAHLRSVSLLGGMLPQHLFRPETWDLTAGYDPFLRGRNLFSRCGSSEMLSRLLYLDMKTLMVDDILTKVDRSSMAVGLEVRVPLLDHRVVELVARMPSLLKLNGSTNKYVLRRVAQQWIGGEIARRPKKGFDVPLDTWFRGPLREMAADLLTSSDGLCAQWLAPAAVRQIMNQHQTGLRRNGHVLWMLLNLELWSRRHTRTAQPQDSGRLSPDPPVRKERREVVLNAGI